MLAPTFCEVAETPNENYEVNMEHHDANDGDEVVPEKVWGQEQVYLRVEFVSFFAPGFHSTVSRFDGFAIYALSIFKKL